MAVWGYGLRTSTMHAVLTMLSTWQYATVLLPSTLKLAPFVREARKANYFCCWICAPLNFQYVHMSVCAENVGNWSSSPQKRKLRLILRRGRPISNIFGARAHANVLKGTFSMDYKSNCIRIGLSSFFFFICTLHESPPCRRISPHRGVPNDPRGSFVVYPLLSLGVVTPENKSIHWTMPSICKKVHLKAVLTRMQLTPHATCSTPHSASRLVQGNVCLVGENPTCSVPAL